MTDAAATMKAIRFHHFGGPEVLRIDEVPVPAPGKGEIRVRVRAAGVNPVDWKFRSGAAEGLVPLSLPLTPGTEIAGNVDAVGEDVTGWSVGDPVMAFIGLWNGYAEFAVFPAALAAKKPDGISYAEAAGAPLSVATAWGALIDTARIEAGQRILIIGAAGAVGAAAIQIAKTRGAEVIATSSLANRQRVLALGADLSLAYDADEERDAGEIDLVLDLIGWELSGETITRLAPRARYISVVWPSDAEAADAGRDRSEFFGVAPDGDRLRLAVEHIARGDIRLLRPIEFSMEEAAEAHRLSESGHPPGRLVIAFPQG